MRLLVAGLDMGWVLVGLELSNFSVGWFGLSCIGFCICGLYLGIPLSGSGLGL